MKVLNYLAILTFLFSGGSASANWRDDNPNKPNGYEASMLRYHYGTPDDSEPHNGYRATEIRARNGLDIYAPPSSDDGWGSRGGDEGGSRFGSGDGGRSNGLLGSHFRQGQAEAQSYWKQRLQTRMPSDYPNGGMAAARPQQMYENMPAAYQQNSWQGAGNAQWPQRAYPTGDGAFANQMNNQFRANYNPSTVNTSVNYQYAPGNPYGVNATALRSAMTQRPIGTLLRNSQGGFNRIYTGE